MKSIQAIKDSLSENTKKINNEPVDRKTLQADIAELQEEVEGIAGQISYLEDELSFKEDELRKMKMQLKTAPVKSELPALMDENRRLAQYLKDVSNGKIKVAA